MTDKLVMTINRAMREVLISKEMEAGHSRAKAEKIVEQLLSKTKVISA